MAPIIRPGLRKGRGFNVPGLFEAVPRSRGTPLPGSYAEAPGFAGDEALRVPGYDFDFVDARREVARWHVAHPVVVGVVNPLRPLDLGPLEEEGYVILGELRLRVRHLHPDDGGAICGRGSVGGSGVSC